MQTMDAGAQERAQRIADHRSSLWVYRIVRRLIIVVLFRYFRVRHRGAHNLNVEGAVIVAPVHRSNLDAPLIAGVGSRRMRALAKEALFSNRLLAAFLAALGAFPVRRGGTDREAMRAAGRILRGGEQMIVFPEGSRQSGPKVTGVFDGMSYLASKTGAIIVPVGVAGTESAMGTGRYLPRRERVAIVAGAPIHLPEGRMSRPQLTRFSEMVTERLQDAFDEARALAGDGGAGDAAAAGH